MTKLWTMAGAGTLLSVAAFGLGVWATQPSLPAASTETNQTAEFDAMVRDYLLRNPEIITEAQFVLAERQEAERTEQQRAAISSLSEQLFTYADAPVFGPAEAPITVVEFFDYNCSFCKRAHDDMVAILDTEDDVNFVIKEFPILGPDSFAAHRVAVAFHRLYPSEYRAFHDALLTAPSRADEDLAMTTALALGADEGELRAEMADPAIEQEIGRVYGIAEALGINGTPAYIIGDEVVSGAVGADEMRQRIAAVRDKQPES